MSVGSRRGGGEGGGAETGAAAVRGAVAGWSAADWLSQRGELAAEIARVRERDANGHVAHAIVATLAIFMQPIANAPANIGFGMLVAMCALRVHRLWRVWALMFREPFWLLLVAWAAWTGITLLWSEDFDYGFRQWTAFRAILWVPMIWPVIDRWRWLVGALLAGVAVGNCIQILQFQTGWPRPKFNRFPGVGLHMSTYMAAWSAVAFAIWMMRAVTGSWIARACGAAMAALAGAGVILSGTRGVAVALVVEVCVVSVMLLIARPRWLLMSASRLLLGVVLIVTLWFTLGSLVEKRFGQFVANSAQYLPGQVEPGLTGGTPAADHDALGMVGKWVLFVDPSRGSVWIYSVRQWAKSPVTGIGAGSVIRRTKSLAAQGLGDGGLRPQHLQIGHPHSMWLQTLAEGGSVGFALLGSWVGAVLLAGWRNLNQDPTAPTRAGVHALSGYLVPGLMGAFVAFLVASQFDSYHMNSTAFAMGVIPAALLCGLGLRPAVRRAAAAS